VFEEHVDPSPSARPQSSVAFTRQASIELLQARLQEQKQAFIYDGEVNACRQVFTLGDGRWTGSAFTFDCHFNHVDEYGTLV